MQRLEPTTTIAWNDDVPIDASQPNPASHPRMHRSWGQEVKIALSGPVGGLGEGADEGEDRGGGVAGADAVDDGGADHGAAGPDHAEEAVGPLAKVDG